MTKDGKDKSLNQLIVNDMTSMDETYHDDGRCDRWVRDYLSRLQLVWHRQEANNQLTINEWDHENGRNIDEVED